MGLDRDLKRLERLLQDGEHSRAAILYESLLKRVGLPGDEDAIRLDLVRGRLLAREGKYGDAITLGRKLLANLRRTTNPDLLAWCHLLLSGWLLRTGDYHASTRHAEAGIYLCRWEIKDAHLEGDFYNNLGLAQKNLGLWGEAERSLKRALDAYPRADGAAPNLRIASNLAVLLRKKGKILEAASICREGLHLCRRSGLRLLECRYALELANIALVMRDTDVGCEHLRRASRIAESHSYTREMILAKEIDGDLFRLLGRFHDALGDYLDALVQVADFLPCTDLECELLRRIAGVYLQLGNTCEARQYIERGIRLAERLSDRYEHGICLRVLGQIETKEGLTACGLDHLRQSVDVLSSLSVWSPELAVSEYTSGCAILTCRDNTEQDEPLIHLLAARRIYSNLGVGQGIREIDDVVSSLVSARPLSVTRTLPEVTRGFITRRRVVDLQRYGIVTGDERIVGDLARWGVTDVRVLIEGETGVGKELVAHTLHALGRRREHRFVALDCGALSETLADSELFGHVKGSFTGALRDRVGLIEEADGGTLLLDEVGELSEMLQTKLLRVLEERKVRRVGENKCRPVDIRVMSATTKDLGQAVEAGCFRRDLYYRLKGVLIRVPALRERRGDIDLLLDHFLRIQGETCGRKICLGREARRLLREYYWPGNVRELKSTVEALVASSEDKTVVTADSLDRLMLSPHRESGHPRRLKEIEREEIERALSACGGNKSEAARVLGITRQSLYSKLGRE